MMYLRQFWTDIRLAPLNEKVKLDDIRKASHMFLKVGGWGLAEFLLITDLPENIFFTADFILMVPGVYTHSMETNYLSLVHTGS